MVHVLIRVPRFSNGLKLNVALGSVTLLLRIRKVVGCNLSLETE